MVISSILNYFNDFLSFTSVNAKPCFIKTYKLFVYGTLKRNEPDNEWLTDPKNGVATFITEAKTRKKFPLIIATKYHMPGLLNWPGRGCTVQGEIYEVNVPMMGKLDKLVNSVLYTREEIDIAVLTKSGAQETVRCHVYFFNSMTEDLLSRRYLGKYSAKGKHGLPYIRYPEATLEDLEDPIKY